MSYLEQYFQKKQLSEEDQKKVELELAGEKLLKKHSPGFFSKLIDILDRPGNATRALLVGKLGGLKGLIPFAQVIENLTGWDIALNKEDRVTGEEVINKLFGKQRQRKGKLDPVDVLGVLVEIVADPLWLLGGAGLTKAGKAKSLVASAIRKSVGSAEEIAKIRSAIRAAKAGTPIADDVSRTLAKALKTVYESGKVPSLGKTWAQQAARGERGLLNVLGRPVIKGQKTFETFSKIANKYKMGSLGKLFLAPSRRVSEKYAGLHDIVVKHARTLPEKQQANLLQDLLNMSKEMEGIGDVNVINRKMTEFIESHFAPQAIRKSFGRYKQRITEKAARKIGKLEQKLADVKKRILTHATELQMTTDKRRIGQLRGAMTRLGKSEETLTAQIPKTRAALKGSITRRLRKQGARAAERAKTHKAAARQILEEIPEAKRGTFKEIAERLRARNVEWVKAEKAARLPSTELDRYIEYMHRALTPEARSFLAEKNLTEKYFNKVRELSVRGGFQRKRGKMADWLRSEIQQHFGTMGFEGNVFEPKALTASFLRGRSSIRKIGAANAITESVNKFSKTEDMLRLTGESIDDWLPVEKLYEKVGLKFGKGEFAGQYIPKEVFTALNDTYRVSTSEEALQGFWNAYRTSQRLLKGSFTLPFPAYHTRNAISNFYLNWIGGVKSAKAYGLAARLQTAAGKTHRLMQAEGLDFLTAAKRIDWPKVNGMAGWKFWDMADEYGVVGRSLGIMDVAEVAGQQADVLLHPAQKGIRGMAGRITHGQDIVSRTGRNVGRTIEDNARLAHFIDKTSKGFSPMDAARHTKEVLFDYGDLSPFEKKYMRDRLFFFYTFARKNLPLQIRTLVQQPAKASLFAHAAGGTPMAETRNLYPDYWNERLTVPVGDKVLAGTGLPFEEAFGPFGAPGVGFANRLRRGISRQITRLSPLINTPYEFATGTNIYFDSPIRSYREWAAQKLPTGRLYGTVKQAVESPDPWGSKISGFTTGVRYKPFNPAEQGKWKIREIARKYLENSKARVYKRYYTKQPAQGFQQAALQVQ